MEKKLSKRVENTVEKGEIAHYEFSKDLHCRHVKNRACLGKGPSSLKPQDNQSIQITDSMR